MSTKKFWICTVLWVIVASLGLLYLLQQQHLDLLRGIGFYAAGVAIAPLGLYLAVNRTKTLESQSENDRKRRIGEEFTRSIELLSGKSAAVRQGGIYALEALAEETGKKRRSTIIKIVASYIRETNKAKPIGGEAVAMKVTIDPDGVDIAAALSVIRNLMNSRDAPYQSADKVDLSNAYLRNGDLSRAWLYKADMSDILVEDSVLARSIFESANMVSADFSECDFNRADFSDADLRKATFRGKCNFQNAVLHGAKLYAANLDGVINLTQEQIDVAQGDEKTVLPSGVRRPPNWPPLRE